jgi:Ser/Thr protein kinase RdoA (MazF antagonist)
MQVKTEHDILAQLSQQTLSFKVPAAKPTLKGSEPYVVLSNEAAACVFEIIPGASPHAELQQGFAL